MSIAAGRTFIAAVNKSKADFKADVKTFYDRFIDGNEKPTKNDIDALTAIIVEAQAVAKFYHGDVDSAMNGFGGGQDNTIRSSITMLNTMKQRAKAR